MKIVAEAVVFVYEFKNVLEYIRGFVEGFGIDSGNFDFAGNEKPDKEFFACCGFAVFAGTEKEVVTWFVVNGDNSFDHTVRSGVSFVKRRREVVFVEFPEVIERFGDPGCLFSTG